MAWSNVQLVSGPDGFRYTPTNTELPEGSSVVEKYHNTSNYINGILQQQANDFNAEMAKRQNDWNVEMWERNNEYNSPEQQVQRYRDAGLNVGAMMSGQSAIPSAALQSSNLATAQGASVNAADPTPSIISSLGQVAEGISSTVSDMFNKSKERTLQERLLDKQLLREDKKIDIAKRQAEADVKLKDIQGLGIISSNEVNAATIDQIKQNIVNLQSNVRVMDKSLEVYDATIENLRASAFKSRKEGDMVRYNAFTNRMNALSNQVQANATKELYKKYGEKSDSEIKLNNQQSKNLAEQLINIRKDGQLKDIQIQYQGKMYSADLELKNGQITSVNIQNDIADKEKYANIANAYISVIDNASTTISHGARAVLDVSTGGATTVAPTSSSHSYGDGPNGYSEWEKHLNYDDNPTFFRMGK